MTDATFFFHPYANLFPMMEGTAFDELAEDIRKNGLQQKITVDEENRILDGRNRYNACLASGIPPTFEPFLGDDPLKFVISRNLHRRHLTDGQRSLIAARLANLPTGRPSNESRTDGRVSQPDAAGALNVSDRSLRRAKQVLDSGNETLIRGVERGVLEVATAAGLVNATPEDQQRAVEDPTKASTFAKQSRRVEREIELSEATLAASERVGSQLYSVIYADPPWRFEPYSRDTGMDRSADNHYPTMPANDLLAMKVPSAPDCVLFLWATTPMLPQAIDLMRAWGFTYKSNVIWSKDKIGTGYWFRNQHEILLVGTKGDVPAPAPGLQVPSVIPSPVLEHSAKPEAFYNMIEIMFPHQTPLEMFARGEPRDGWDQWGNEAAISFGEAESDIDPPWLEDIHPAHIRELSRTPSDDELPDSMMAFDDGSVGRTDGTEPAAPSPAQVAAELRPIDWSPVVDTSGPDPDPQDGFIFNPGRPAL